MPLPKPEPESEVDPLAPPRPPGEDELPYDDGEPMESTKHRKQMTLLIETLQSHYVDQPRVFIGGNLGVYYSELQAVKNEFRAPDFMVVLDAEPRQRKSWVIWQEECGPDLVIELLSEKTESEDRGRKMTIYEKVMRVPEYYLFDPVTNALEGFVLDATGRAYRTLTPQLDGSLRSKLLGLRLVLWTGTYLGVHDTWLRWATDDGALLPTGFEAAQAAEHAAKAAGQAAQAAEQAAQAATRALEAEKARADRLLAQLRAAGIEPS